MGIRFCCPNGHKLHVKEFQAGLKGICPYCNAKFQIPLESTRSSTKEPGGKEPSDSNADDGSSGELQPDQPPTEQGSPPPETRQTQPPEAEPHEPQPSVTPPDQQRPRVPDSSLADGVSDAPNTEFLGEKTQVSPFAHLDAPVTVPEPTPPSPPAEVDPLIEGGDASWYVRLASGGQFGPAAPDVMRQWIDEGRVSGDSLVWREGWEDWRESADVFPHLAVREIGAPSGPEAPSGTSVATEVRNRRLMQRQHSRKNQMTVIITLIGIILVLAVVFVWALWRGADTTGNARGEQTVFVCQNAGFGHDGISPSVATLPRGPWRRLG